MSLAAILAAAQAAQSALAVAHAFSPMIGMTYQMAAAAMPPGSSGAQKLDAFKSIYMKVMAADAAAEALVAQAWPVVSAAVSVYHTTVKSDPALIAPPPAPEPAAT